MKTAPPIGPSGNKTEKIHFDIIDDITTERPGPRPTPIEISDKKQFISTRAHKTGKRYNQDGHRWQKYRIMGETIPIRYSRKRSIMRKNIKQVRQQITGVRLDYKSREPPALPKQRYHYIVEKIITKSAKGEKNVFYLKYDNAGKRAALISILRENYDFYDYYTDKVEDRVRSFAKFTTPQARLLGFS